MFQQGEAPKPASEKMYIGLRILMVAGAGMLLAFGLCGVGTMVPHIGNSAVGTVSIAGLVLFVLSLLALVIGVITLVIELIVRR